MEVLHKFALFYYIYLFIIFSAEPASGGKFGFLILGRYHKTMSAIFILIIISLMIAVGFLVAFIWAIKSGQFDDNFTPSIRMLWDDKKKMSPSSTDQVEEEK